MYAPPELVVLRRVKGLLPRRAFEAILRVTKAGEVLSHIDTAQRAAYEERAFASARPAQEEREPVLTSARAGDR